jgi:hypothetical protein
LPDVFTPDTAATGAAPVSVLSALPQEKVRMALATRRIEANELFMNTKFG